MIVRCRGQRVLWLVRPDAAARSSESGLTESGRRQVLRVAALLASKDIAGVYANDAAGAWDAAAVIAGQLGRQVSTDGRLCRQAADEPDEDLFLRYATFVEWIGSRRYPGDLVVVADASSLAMLRAVSSGHSPPAPPRGSMAPARVCRVVLATPAGRAQVGTAPTTSSTWTPRPGREPRLTASPKLNTPPSRPIRL